MKHLITLLSGIIFGIALHVAGMSSPTKVINFLNITGEWDPSLIFVMIGAILVFSTTFWLQRKFVGSPIIATVWDLPSKIEIEPNLIYGPALFGIGWGILGICPGPAFANLFTLNPHIVVLTLSLFVGFYLNRLREEKLSKK